MARLNEAPVSSDSIETLRRRMLRQNRDLAKSNNIRALRIRELENECACILSENLQLRSRILELEKQVQDSDARRIADHALAIKAKLESQLTEWGTLLAGLGLEPPIKRHSPRITKSTRPRMSFSASRPSPSKRRLRDVARDIEELGHISESKAARRSMNPEQILALRSEVDSADSPELGPPPMSKFIDEDPVKVDSPSRPAARDMAHEPSSAKKIEPPVSFPSPQKHNTHLDPAWASPAAEPPSPSPSPRVSLDQPDSPSEPTTAQQPIKTGSKRKLSVIEGIDTIPVPPTIDENHIPMGKLTLEDRADKGSKEEAPIRKDAREKRGPSLGARKPLGAKNTNQDMRSPKKMGKPTTSDQAPTSKMSLAKPTPKAPGSRNRSRAKNNPSVKVEALAEPDMAPQSTKPAPCLSEPALLLTSSPEPVSGSSTHRGDTPPPVHLSGADTARPGRRSRAAISYAEPNLRDKMRRPSKQLYDAVAGEGKYSRRSSTQAEVCGPDIEPVKRESLTGGSWQTLPAADAQTSAPSGDYMPESPLAGKSSPPQPALPDTVVTDRRRRPSSVSSRASAPLHQGSKAEDADTSAGADTSASCDVDVYEFTSSSPQPEHDEAADSRKSGRRQTLSSRRISAAVDSDGGGGTREGSSTRRRSMLV